MTTNSTSRRASGPTQFDTMQAETYAGWFACLAEPTRVRMLHMVATSPTGEVTVGDLAEHLGISQSTASHHLQNLAATGFVHLTRRGASTMVSVNAACCKGLPHAADVLLGSFSQRQALPADLPSDVEIRAMKDGDFNDVRLIYAEGIATKSATFETIVPSASALRQKWLPGHRWVACLDSQVVGWAAIARVSPRPCYSGVGESAVYVGEGLRGRGVGRALLHRQVNEADTGGIWTLQASIFPQNRSSIALHHAAGFRTLAIRDRIAKLDGEWRDTVLLERRSETAGESD